MTDLDIKKTVAFSGHRIITPPVQASLFGEASPDSSYEASVRRQLADTLQALINRGYNTFICGMATGFDLMAGEAVCQLLDEGHAVKLVAAIPFPGQADGFPPRERDRYDSVLSRAGSRHIVCPEYRPECFHRRNDYLVDNASVLVCFYNGSPGGTRYTVKKALAKKLEVINLCDI